MSGRGRTDKIVPMLRAAALLLFLLALGAPAVACVGDCNADGVVAVDELVRGVTIALGAGTAGACIAMDPDRSGAVGVDELVFSVGAALHGCCGDGVAAAIEECDDGNEVDGDGCSADCHLEPGGNPCAGVASVPGTGIRAELVATVDQPTHVASAPLDPNRIFITEQPGRIRVVDGGRLLEQPFLDIHERVSCCDERGLLSVVFDRDYDRNGRFFVDYTNVSGDTVISRFRVTDDPDRADPASEQILITIDQPFANHNGGLLAFGPDGFLYCGMGDGGSANDPRENAQNDQSLLGKLLRFDVAVEGPPFYAVPASNPHAERGDRFGLVWAKGLRNPWRFSFDRATGDLYIGDVGQADREEVDVQPAASSGGENYGWDVYEGNRCNDPAPLFPACPVPPPADFKFPVLEYTHGDGNCSITGGFVYRGCALPDLRGTYFYADYCSGLVRSFVWASGLATDQLDWTEALDSDGVFIDAISTFGEDTRGELYIADLDGPVYKLVPATPASTP